VDALENHRGNFFHRLDGKFQHGLRVVRIAFQDDFVVQKSNYAGTLWQRSIKLFNGDFEGFGACGLNRVIERGRNDLPFFRVARKFAAVTQRGAGFCDARIRLIPSLRMPCFERWIFSFRLPQRKERRMLTFPTNTVPDSVLIAIHDLERSN
jgi:hypothetical protein